MDGLRKKPIFLQKKKKTIQDNDRHQKFGATVKEQNPKNLYNILLDLTIRVLESEISM